MAAAAEGNTTSSCSCSNISIMQLFHELKQQFPAVPDRVVSECIRQNFHDKETCEAILSRENQTYLLPSYPTSLKMSSGPMEPESAFCARLHGDKSEASASVRDNRCQCDMLSTSASQSYEKCDINESVSRSDIKGHYQHNLSTSISRSENRWLYQQFSQGVPSDLTVPSVDHFEKVGVRSTRVDNTSQLSLCQSNNNKTEPPGNRINPSSRELISEARDLPPIGHRPCVRPTSLNVIPSCTQQQTCLRSAPVISSSFEPFHNTPTSVQDGRYSFPVTSSQCAHPHLRPLDSNICGSGAFTTESSIQSPVLYGDSYEVKVNCSVQRRPVPEGPRVRSALNVQPVPHYWGAGIPVPTQPRSYTSVNLTLRPPSSEPQPPIDIQTGPSSLTYSTSSYDARGFRSDLQIRIGPGGTGSVSAMRMRPQNPSWVPRPQAHPLAMLTESSETSSASLEDSLRLLDLERLQPATKVLLEQQMERKNHLQTELQREKEKLRSMQRDVRGMEKDLRQRQLLKNCPAVLPAFSTVLQKVQRLRQEIHVLQEECKKMTQEVDISSPDARVPLGETDEEFYKNIYTGQHGFVALRPVEEVPSHRVDMAHEAGEGPHWTCTECTFRNHPLLDKCEQCEMPRIMLAGGETQDIHIHVTRHNFPIRIT